VFVGGGAVDPKAAGAECAQVDCVSRCLAEHHVDRSGVRAHVVGGEPSSDDHIAQSVAVHIAETGHRLPGLVARANAVDPKAGPCKRTQVDGRRRWPAEDDVCRAGLVHAVAARTIGA
jgi:hypothetical protein